MKIRGKALRDKDESRAQEELKETREPEKTSLPLPLPFSLSPHLSPFSPLFPSLSKLSHIPPALTSIPHLRKARMQQQFQKQNKTVCFESSATMLPQHVAHHKLLNSRQKNTRNKLSIQSRTKHSREREREPARERKNVRAREAAQLSV